MKRDRLLLRCLRLPPHRVVRSAWTQRESDGFVAEEIAENLKALGRHDDA